ncbi:hypothetical protein BFP72_13330 [Reichenbachiella sp. 5M10]|uniref:hypothetical protein n=1 Tax=Reichenbachiella sp. 5M10 TaxID=1889772 RepID=UPI000C150D45|nr:hypothetical protein [Reichenbachiella sp. 5M10]PIB36305.1 hypothetical protein BFP72_13330 [Reichenbachiella sp. 5M10]
MKSLFKTILFIATITLSLKGLASDGVLITSKSKDLSTNQITTSNIYLTDSKLQITNSGADNSSMIFDAQTEVFTFIDNRKREYYQFDKPTLKQLKEQLMMMIQMMKQFASQMPEDQQEKIDKMLNPNSGTIIAYKEIGTSRTGSWNTTNYQGTSDNQKVLELNIASFQNLGIAESKFTVMKSLVEFFKENLQEVAAMLPTNQAMSTISFDENSPVLKEGIPIKTTSYESGNSQSETTVEKITETNIPESQFAIPSGYVRKTINMQKAFER